MRVRETTTYFDGFQSHLHGERMTIIHSLWFDYIVNESAMVSSKSMCVVGRLILSQQKTRKMHYTQLYDRQSVMNHENFDNQVKSMWRPRTDAGQLYPCQKIKSPDY